MTFVKLCHNKHKSKEKIKSLHFRLFDLNTPGQVPSTRHPAAAVQSSLGPAQAFENIQTIVGEGSHAYQGHRADGLVGA